MNAPLSIQGIKAPASLGFERPVGRYEVRVYVAVLAIYLALFSIVVATAGANSVFNPRATAISGVVIFLADLFNASMLGAAYRAAGHPFLATLSAAFLFSGLCALVYPLTFEDAVFTGWMLGTPSTSILIGLSWRLGAAALFLGAVLQAGRPADPAESRPRRLLPVRWATVACTALLLAILAALPVQLTQSGLFAASALAWVAVGLYVLSFVLIWAWHWKKPVLLWLSLVAAVFAADFVFRILADTRFTLGWNLSRVSMIFVASILPLYWLNCREGLLGRRLEAVSVYAAGLFILFGMELVHWYLLPWLGFDSPFIFDLAATALAAWLGGWGPGALIATVGFLANQMLFQGPHGGLALDEAQQALQALMYAVTSGIVIWLVASVRGSRNRHRRAEAVLRDQASVLMAADRNRSQFLAVLSHELRNCLEPMRLGVDLLGRKDKPGQVRALPETLNMLERQLGHMTHLINDLLDVSRIERGKFDLVRERLDLTEIIDDCAANAMPAAEARGHRLTVSHARVPLHVVGDRRRLRQAFSNLIGNALKFTAAGGRIDIASRSDGTYARMSVRDTGIGISPEDLWRVFQMFEQLGPGQDVKHGGLGLGLSLAQQIVELHDGRIEARSEGPGMGAEFIVLLPLPGATPPPAAEE